MKELEKMAVQDLLHVYRLYLNDGLTRRVISIGESVYLEYLPAILTLLRDDLNRIITTLFPIAYPNSGNDELPPTKKLVKEFIKELEVIQKELEN